jgi:hypothetical protein
MLTLRHVEASGHESVRAAVEVGYQPKNANGAAVPKALFAYGCPGPDSGAQHGGVVEYGNGRVFVMNDAGETVALYDLDSE